MASKLGLILSMMIIFVAFLFGADLVMLQVQYSDLDSMSTLISYKISKEAQISDSLLTFCEERNVIIEADNDKEIGFEKGDVFKYVLKKEYKPLVLSNEPFEVSITRYTVISILN